MSANTAAVERVAWPASVAQWAAVVTGTAPHPTAAEIASAAAAAREAAHAHWEDTGTGVLREAVRRTCPWVGQWAYQWRPEGRVLKPGDCPWCGMAWRRHR